MKAVTRIGGRKHGFFTEFGIYDLECCIGRNHVAGHPAAGDLVRVAQQQTRDERRFAVMRQPGHVHGFLFWDIFRIRAVPVDPELAVQKIISTVHDPAGTSPADDHVPRRIGGDFEFLPSQRGIMTQDYCHAVFSFQNSLRSPEDFRQIILQFLFRIHFGGNRLPDVEPDPIPVVDRDLSAKREQNGK